MNLRLPGPPPATGNAAAPTPGGFDRGVAFTMLPARQRPPGRTSRERAPNALRPTGDADLQQFSQVAQPPARRMRDPSDSGSGGAPTPWEQRL